MSPGPEDDESVADAGGEAPPEDDGSDADADVDWAEVVETMAGGADGDGEGAGARKPCPECDASLPEQAGFCPHCETLLGETGETVSLSELEGLLDQEDRRDLMTVDADGNRTAARWVRVLAGLAVSIPLAPLVLFLVSTVTALTPVAAVVTFLLGWAVPAAFLSRAHLPAAAFGRSLYLVGAGTLLIPVGVAFGPASAVPSEVGESSFALLTAVSLLVAVVAFGLGAVVSRHARRRVSGEVRAFESARDVE